MAKTFTPEQVVALGEGIQQFLNNEHVQEVWDALDELYYKQWKDSDTPAAREELMGRVRALGDLRNMLERTAQIGQDTALMLERQSEGAS